MSRHRRLLFPRKNPSPLCSPRSARRLLLPLLVLGVRRFKVVGIDVFHVCNAHAHENLLPQTAKQQGANLTGTMVTCSGSIQAKGRRASIPTATSSRKALPPQRVFVDLAGPRKIASAGEGRYLIVFKDDATRIPVHVPGISHVAVASLIQVCREFRLSTYNVYEWNLFSAAQVCFIDQSRISCYTLSVDKHNNHTSVPI